MSQPPPSASRVLALLAAFTATSVVAGVLLSGLFMPAVGATGAVANNSVDFFNSLPSDLQQDPLSEGSTLVSQTGSKIATFYEENRTQVKLDQIAKVMQDAIVAIEDERFYSHGGVDPKGLIRAAATNFASGTTAQGASTLTQQYVKNVLVERATVKGDDEAADAAVEKSKKRKIQEIKLAISVEKQLSKQEILNRYLNISYFGHRVYGVEAAARYYFRKSAKDLTLPEAATLAGTVQLPARWDPEDKPDRAKERRNVVLGQMLKLKMITQQQHDEAAATDVKTKITPGRPGCVNAGSSGYFCNYIQELITKSNDFKSLGATQEARRQSLLRGGLTIQTTMLPVIQSAAWSAVKDTIPTDDPSGVKTAAVTVEPGTGRVLAIAQNSLFDPAGGPGKTATNYSVDYEYGGSTGFQTGSTFKPFTLATWLRKGKSLNATVSAEGGPAPFSAFKACGDRLRGPSYDYRNAEGDGSGSMSVLNATFNSVNTAYVSMEKQLDLCDIKKTAQSLGVHLASVQKSDCPSTQGPETRELPTCTPSLTLGPKELAPMTMSAAFATFASGGIFCKPIAVLSIKDRNGKAYAVPKQDCRRALDKDVVSGVNYALQKVLTEGTAASVGGIGRPAAGKTGTTNSSVDTWFVGYSAQRATAVWVGDPVPKPTSKGSKVLLRKSLNRRTIAGEKQRNVYGATFAAPIWKKIMTKAHDGLPKRGFSAPPGRLLVSDKVGVPDVKGQPVNAAIDALKAAGFAPNVSGGVIDSNQPAGTVASTSPGAGSKLDKGATVAIAVSNGRGGGGRGDGGGLFPGFNP